MAWKKLKVTELDVFKGREARLNRATFKTLTVEQPLSTREVHKKIVRLKGMRGTSYSTANKRMRDLEQSGFLKKTIVRERVGGITNLYELRPKAYLALFLGATSLNEILDRITDAEAESILSELLSIYGSDSETK